MMLLLIGVNVLLVFELQHAYILEYNVHVTGKRFDLSLIHLISKIDLFSRNHALNLRLHQNLTLGHHLVVEDLVLFSIKGYK